MIRDNLTLRQRKAFACFQLETGKPVEVCIVRHCQRPCRRNGTVCALHNMQKWRREHPEAAQYSWLKAEAKKRRKPFSITREEWWQLCALTRYHEGTASRCGSVPEGLTIDRLDHRRGYSLDNIAVVVNRLNSAKGAQEMQCRLKNGRHVLLRAAQSVAQQLAARDATENLEKLIDSL